MSALGSKIRDLRQKRGMTLEELARKVGSSKSYIWELENKEDAKPSADRLYEIAKMLGVTVDYFLSEDVTEEDAEDVEFFRKYKDMGGTEKRKLRKFLDILDDEDEDDD